MGGWGGKGPVGHKDLWEALLHSFNLYGDAVGIMWVPSHAGVHGNEQADIQAEQGRSQHPDNEEQRPKRCKLWEDLGLVAMPDAVTDSDRSSSACSDSDLGSTGEEGTDSSEEEALGSSDSDSSHSVTSRRHKRARH